MTTIATDGKSMAGDSMVTGNGIVHSTSFLKVRRISGGRIVGASGSAYAFDRFIEWLETADMPNPKLPEHFEALVLLPDGSCRCFDEDCASYIQETPAITGSGGAIALGAMLAGATPAQAVAIAAQRDMGTGGTITVETLGN